MDKDMEGATQKERDYAWLLHWAAATGGGESGNNVHDGAAAAGGGASAVRGFGNNAQNGGPWSGEPWTPPLRWREGGGEYKRLHGTVTYSPGANAASAQNVLRMIVFYFLIKLKNGGRIAGFLDPEKDDVGFLLVHVTSDDKGSPLKTTVYIRIGGSRKMNPSRISRLQEQIRAEPGVITVCIEPLFNQLGHDCLPEVGPTAVSQDYTQLHLSTTRKHWFEGNHVADPDDRCFTLKRFAQGHLSWHELGKRRQPSGRKRRKEDVNSCPAKAKRSGPVEQDSEEQEEGGAGEAAGGRRQQPSHHAIAIATRVDDEAQDSSACAPQHHWPGIIKPRALRPRPVAIQPHELLSTSLQDRNRPQWPHTYLSCPGPSYPLSGSSSSFEFGTIKQSDTLTLYTMLYMYFI